MSLTLLDYITCCNVVHVCRNISVICCRYAYFGFKLPGLRTKDAYLSLAPDFFMFNDVVSSGSDPNDSVRVSNAS